MPVGPDLAWIDFDGPEYNSLSVLAFSFDLRTELFLIPALLMYGLYLFPSLEYFDNG